MKGYHQIVKLAIGCLFLAALLHVPGMIYAQEKSTLKLDLFDFPVAPGSIINNHVDNFRDLGALPMIGILPMESHQTPTHVIVPYLLYDIHDQANVSIKLDTGSGLLISHEDLIKDEADNNQVQFTAIRNTALQGNNLSIWIEACQSGFVNCTNVVIIVTVDGRPPKNLSANGN